VAAESQARIKAMIPFAEPRNPVDTTAQVVADITLIAKVFDAMVEQTEFDVLICFLAQSGWSRRYFDRLRGPLAAVRRAHPSVPFVLALGTTPDTKAELEEDGFLVFEDPTRAALAAGALVQFGRVLAEPARAMSPISAASLPVEALGEIEAATLLAAAGVPMVVARLARSADEAVALADATGYPVVLKIVSPDIAHKTDAGGVKLRLADAAAVRAAFAQIMADVAERRPTARLDGVLVAPHVLGGTEILLGAKNDPVFGPVVVVGLGGIFVELFAETSLRLAPVDEAEARRMIGETRAGRLLAGLRGAPAGDLAGLARAVAALSRFAAAHAADVDSIDINPCLVTEDAVIGLDALIVRRSAA
jgi:acyl-CoA synthetase (NDP forming)